MRPRTRAVSFTDSFLPKWMSGRVRYSPLPPSSRTAMSVELRVRVELFSKMSAMFLRCSRSPRTPALRRAFNCAARSMRLTISSSVNDARRIIERPLRLSIQVSIFTILSLKRHIIANSATSGTEPDCVHPYTDFFGIRVKNLSTLARARKRVYNMGVCIQVVFFISFPYSVRHSVSRDASRSSGERS